MKTSLALLSVSILSSLTTQAFSAKVSECEQQAKTPLEKVYCKVKAESTSASLPTLYTFRKNNEKMQRLLLRKPAAKAGIPLPPESANSVAHLKKNSQKSIAHKAKRSEPSERALPLKGCRLSVNSIQCNESLYTLQNNLQNYQLSVTSLEPTNKLKIPSRDSKEFSRLPEQQYLSSAYTRYIEKMLDIGLGGSTMSFTKFVAIYEDQTKNRTNFAERFETMYELLKQERKINGIQSDYRSSLPRSIEQCMKLSNKILVCDDVSTNWVYLNQTRRQ